MPIQWRAHYSDGTSFPQYNPEGTENRYADIDKGRLIAFELEQDDRPIFCMHLDAGARLIYRRRVFMRPGEGQIVFYLVGWQKTVGGENVQSVAIIPENNPQIHMIGKWRDDHPVFASIEPMPGEEL